MNSTDTLNKYVSAVNKRLGELIGSHTLDDVVSRAASYSLESGGKRIRPVLTLEFCRLCGAEPSEALDYACAVEMVHTYSLIHDDLPGMDNDELRRGRPSCHVRFGEGFAILAGDALLTLAFEVIAGSEASRKNPAAGLTAVKILSKCAGARGMIGGQTIDLESEGRSVGTQTLEKMDALKTGALICAAAQLGVAAAGGNEQMLTAAQSYAMSLGAAFQIVDDILDVTADEKVLGKPVGSDSRENKSTYVSCLGLEKARLLAKEKTDEAMSALEVFGGEAEFLRCLSRQLLTREK